jgi:hypothetical protein
VKHVPYLVAHPISVAIAVSVALAAPAVIATRAQTAAPLRFAISFPAARSAQPLDGRVLLFISDEGKTEPKSQSDQYRANTTRPMFGVDVDAMSPGQPVLRLYLTGNCGWPPSGETLSGVGAHEYPARVP